MGTADHLATGNHGWGYQRIQGELLKLPGSQNSADPAGAEAALQTGPAIWARLRLMGGRLIEPMQESRS